MHNNSNSRNAGDVEFDLHGIVGIRLQGASASDVAAVRRQLGPLQAMLTRDPDIVIRFVDKLAAPTTLRFLGVDEAGFTDDAFWILRSKHKSQARVMIPIEQIGNECEIVCERGLRAVPLLIAIINLTALGNGAIPLHGAGFVYHNTGMLATGWSKGGKTETLLAFMAHGAQYVADEWVYLHGDGRMSGIPEPIRVWDWHMESMPRYWNRVSRAGRCRLLAIGLAQTILKCIPGGSWLPGQFKSRLAPLLKRQAYADIAPEYLFGRDRLLMDGPLNKILFVASHDSPEIRVTPIDPDEVARRMVHSLQFEQSVFMGYYRMFRFAFPQRLSDLVENSESLQQELLRTALAHKEAYAVHHPYPVSLPHLFEAIAPLCNSAEAARGISEPYALAQGGVLR